MAASWIRRGLGIPEEESTQDRVTHGESIASEVLRIKLLLVNEYCALY